jgi:hypothetical protein
MHGLSEWRFKPGCLTPIGLIAPWRRDLFGKEDALLKIGVTFHALADKGLTSR